MDVDVDAAVGGAGSGGPLTRSEELALACEESQAYGLSDNAVWCAEMLAGVSPAFAAEPAHFTGTQPFDSGDGDTDSAACDAEDDAVVLIEQGEPLRAWHRVRDVARRGRGVFVAAWARWLAGEEQRQQAYFDKANLLSNNRPENPFSDSLYRSLTRVYHRGGLDAYGLWLYAVVLRDRRMRADAVAPLVAAVVRRPLLWPAWRALSDLAEDGALAAAGAAFARAAPAQNPPHWVFACFEAHLMLRGHRSDAALRSYTALRTQFSTAAPVVVGLAAACYDCNEVEQCLQHWEQLLARDPKRVEDIDRYSNALYMSMHESQLSLLAHQAWTLAPRRAETLCVLGNLYSLHKDSEKAVAYFQRALQLDYRCASAWTFLGHEYSPYQGGIGNVRGCVFAYHRALELDDKDYRAWLGLAQIYYSEFGLPVQADYYAARSVAIRPHDTRLQKIADMIHAEATQKASELEHPFPAPGDPARRSEEGRSPLGWLGGPGWSASRVTASQSHSPQHADLHPLPAPDVL